MAGGRDHRLEMGKARPGAAPTEVFGEVARLPQTNLGARTVHGGNSCDGSLYCGLPGEATPTVSLM